MSVCANDSAEVTVRACSPGQHMRGKGEGEVKQGEMKSSVANQRHRTLGHNNLTLTLT
eukprot:CAMPEP_0174718696 /NCGR_PEP_ID=MMETSP1094-20130205/29746_1 /TAXON_ID=156173 /ORGANISM="Chrysochromulina brevifilum, Strain UTEX LB 985" /LENGTH=57 /DNA_ID=CAMNT_0015918863 /DNA_START=296 /DNA_END=465 /DNA_ORIENTATION=+